jgi:uncharacterized protein (UPF0335 family)
MRWAPSAFDSIKKGKSCRSSRFVRDSPLEGTGFEPSVPLLQKALLGVANRDVGYRPGLAAGAASPPGEEGIMPDVGGIAGAQLKSFIERIERLEEEKRALGEDIKEIYAEAKGTGFEPKIMRQILKIRKTRTSTTSRRACSTSTNAR